MRNPTGFLSFLTLEDGEPAEVGLRGREADSRRIACRPAPIPPFKNPGAGEWLALNRERAHSGSRWRYEGLRNIVFRYDATLLEQRFAQWLLMGA